MINTTAIAATAETDARLPVIDVTDLYHPHQDLGDNRDLIVAYALPELDLKAVILDATERFRAASAYHPIPQYRDEHGPRDCGVIPVVQLNSIFGRNVPWGAGSYAPMRDPEDTLENVPRFQQTGIELILATLRSATQAVQIVSFGSARTIAAAFNRAPELFAAKVGRIHLSAGSSGPEYLEWNVMLDPQAIVCLLSSQLPIDIYPCAGPESPYDYSHHNTFWKLTDLRFVAGMSPALRRYFCYAADRSHRIDFLRALEEDWEVDWERGPYPRPHNMWETAIWQNLTGRHLAQTPAGWRLLRPEEVDAAFPTMDDEFWPCLVKVDAEGRFEWTRSAGESNFRMYYRPDPRGNELALNEAVQAMYLDFRA